MADTLTSVDLVYGFAEKLFRHVEPGRRFFVDVGALYGVWTMRFAPSWSVVAFEPEPRNRAVLLLKTQKYPLTTVLPHAVSDADKKQVEFYFHPEMIGIHSLKANHKELRSDRFIEVDTVRLDTILPEITPAVHVLKTDIEGADLLALRSLGFTNYRPAIVCSEFGKRSKSFGYDHHDHAAYLLEHGYRPYLADWESVACYTLANPPKPPSLRAFRQYAADYEANWGDIIGIREDAVADFEAHASSFFC